MKERGDGREVWQHDVEGGREKGAGMKCRLCVFMLQRKMNGDRSIQEYEKQKNYEGNTNMKVDLYGHNIILEHVWFC